MKTTFYLNSKKISRKVLTEMFGADRLKRYIEEAKETFFEDPLTQNSFWIGGRNMLTIEFNGHSFQIKRRYITMKKNDIRGIYTQMVTELLARGYQIHPETMGGSQGEMAHIDLTNGSEILRVLIETHGS